MPDYPPDEQRQNEAEVLALDGTEEASDQGNGLEKSALKKYQIFEEKIVIVTESNLSQFTLLDILMPVPGWRVKYPENESLKQIYDDILKADGLEDGFKSLHHKIDFYSLPGTYRKILSKPWNCIHRFAEYINPNQDLILSDLDIMRENKLPENLDAVSLVTLGNLY